ncbi:GGDEF domain-containing protein [Saccharopolyspora flava]|uniref:Diguanylate cyclase (GGDEF) domain-containing protein n=1 Tax=Saccharopolyspora flava TaxID=95161 RepID=A0A1I6QSU7_9PSEU|nr:GGDEF domain-containing protein [Saccharopolyspora flava]SFS55489.1 diguanylate cyclase (GGDEF) domain-containing protein [Saccharopolyspora flava]
MQLEDQPLAGHIPAQDRLVRQLLDAGRFTRADAAFDELLAGGSNFVDSRWVRSTVLVHRAVLAWRLGRIPLALELLTDGWTELDTQPPSGGSAAHTISMLGFMLEGIGRRGPAMDLMSLAVQVAREAGDQPTLAHCQLREGISRVFRAASHPDQAAHQFTAARELCEEAQSLAKPGRVKRSALAVLARALAGMGEWDTAERIAHESLKLARDSSDIYASAMANWVLAEIKRSQQVLTEARTYASRALEGAENIHESLLMMRFSQELAEICRSLGDSVGEAAALRRAMAAAFAAVDILKEGLGQALEQRRVATQAQRMAMAAREAALRDPLTGLANRLGLERMAPVLLERTAAAGRIPWLVLLDVDWFKDVNDFAGHTAGDVVLQEVANLLRRECRAGDLLCRWAGDEFVVLLVDAAEDSREAGPLVAERIRAAVNAHDWRLVLGRLEKKPTVSIGVAAGPSDLDQLFASADIALYKAKRAGRNRVETESQAPGSG